VIETPQRIAFLKGIHIFRDVKEEHLSLIAEMLEERKYAPGETIFPQGSRGGELFFIYAGEVRVERTNKKGETEQLAKLVKGDYFGEEEVLSGRPRTASIVAETETLTLVIPPGAFKDLTKRVPRFKSTLEVVASSHRLARATRFKWLQEGEVVYFLARKHWVLLVEALSLPLVTFLLSLFLLAWGILTNSIWAMAVWVVLFLLLLGWAFWNVVDWGNDYYIVTNRRVVWLEKVIGIYDSRQEAPLSTLLSVGVETSFASRLLDYGTVVMRTFVGQINFTHVAHPNEARHLIEEHWQRTKAVLSHMEKESMKNVLRQKLGLPVKPVTQETPKSPEAVRPTRRKMIISLAGLVGGNLFQIRFEDSGTITYRKHWYVLFKQTWKPSAFLLLIVAWMISRAVYLIFSPTEGFFTRAADGGLRADTIFFSLPVLMIPFIIWWIYQYVDWRNDIFQVTQDQILDIDRKPFGTEERRVAPLDNILSTRYERRGLAGYLFNFGTVYIAVGGTNFAFEDVSDPASVQADIDRRRLAARRKKEEAEIKREQERMADWLVAYHENAEEFRRQQESGPKSE
jgi:hypothetical protein